MYLWELCRVLKSISIALIVWAVISIILNVVKGERQVKETRLPWLYGFVFLIAGLFPSILLYANIASDGVNLLFGSIGLVLIYIAVVFANQRVTWDDEGFEYRTALRRIVRYRYDDILTMKTVGGLLTPSPETLFVHVGYRRFFIDGFALWTGFAGSYEKWQIRSGRASWRRAQKSRSADRCRSHSGIGRKLARIPRGYIRAILFTLMGIAMSALGVSMLIMRRDEIGAIGGIFCLAFGFIGFRYWYAVAHLDDKPRLIREYTFYNENIRPDPDAKPKVYRRAKRKKGR